MAHYPRSARNPARVTMRALAEMAGVSVQSVSLALRNQPSIGLETRTRIQALARQLGYTPDPQIVKLMHHLRIGHQHKLGASVCFLTTRPPTARETFCDLLLAGAIEGARTAGFSHHVIHVEPEKMPRDRLMRMLHARGVEGLLLLPMADLRPLDDLLNWREFSVISATLSVASSSTISKTYSASSSGCRRPVTVGRASWCSGNMTGAAAIIPRPLSPGTVSTARWNPSSLIAAINSSPSPFTAGSRRSGRTFSSSPTMNSPSSCDGSPVSRASCP